MSFSEEFYTDRQVEFTRNIEAADYGYQDSTGKPNEGQFKIVKIDCCIRSRSGDVSNNRINGRLLENELTIYTKDIVYTDRDDLKADCLTWNGCNYRVNEVVDNNNSFIPHYRAICEKTEVN